MSFFFYLVFGVLTTGVNIASYWFLAHPLGLPTVPATVAAWVLAVLFAYATNRKWVFRSAARTRGEVLRELVSFFACRVATGLLDVACMYVFAEVLGFHDVMIKTASNGLVIILNYIGSRFIFKG
ncbi:MAG: GtrA family protein [Synergistaceae bacterium]|nr:GtrA family protein [Synergistaceae bacterium]